jgi:hypothetical protein
LDLKITCRACERTYPLTMAIDPESRPGHCPFCGEALAFQYTGTFIDAAGRVLGLGGEFVRQLALFAELAGGFSIEADSVVTPVQDAIGAQDRLLAQPYRPAWPPRPSEPVS